jgi:hypothetical protein
LKAASMREVRRYSRWVLAAVALWAILGCMTNAGAASKLSMDAKQLGTVRYIVYQANQLPGHWGDMTPRDLSYDNQQFQLAFMSYSLAVAQAEYVPAYRELYEKAQLRLIKKMMEEEVWDNWVELVEGKFKVEDAQKYMPSVLPPGQDIRDPVGVDDIAYSGHLLEMISLYQVLYGSHYFDRPGSISFTTPGPHGLHATYDYSSLAQTIYRQFERAGGVGVACEPGYVYMECNEHPILGLMGYDELHHTRLADVRWKFLQTATKLGYIDPRTNQTMLENVVQEHNVVDTTYAFSDGWNGVMLHAWDPALANEVYPSERDAEVPLLLDTNPKVFSVVWGNRLTSFGFALMAAYAAEVGDQDTAKKMLEFADTHFKPKWVDGRYFYPRRDVVPGDFGAAFATHYSYHLPSTKYGEYDWGPATTVELGMARLDPGNGLWDLYNRLTPQTVAALAKSPTLVDVAYPEVQVTRAVYDPDLRKLSVQTVPGTDLHRQTTVAIVNLMRGIPYNVSFDGAAEFSVRDGLVKDISSTARKMSVSWDMGRGHLRVTYLNDGVHNITVLATDAVAVSAWRKTGKGLVAEGNK